MNLNKGNGRGVYTNDKKSYTQKRFPNELETEFWGGNWYLPFTWPKGEYHSDLQTWAGSQATEEWRTWWACANKN